jgi:hypothetical protein
VLDTCSDNRTGREVSLARHDAPAWRYLAHGLGTKLDTALSCGPAEQWWTLKEHALPRGGSLPVAHAKRTCELVRKSDFEMIRSLVLVALLGACSEAPGLEPAAGRLEPLAVSEAWAAVAREADPFVTDASAAPSCSAPGFEAEGGWLELNTGTCNWITLEQPARISVAPGQELNIALAHFDLVAPEPGTALIALALGSCSAWTKSLAIPADAAVYDETFASSCGVSAGDMLRFHLHNHGQNSWQLQRLAVVR